MIETLAALIALSGVALSVGWFAYHVGVVAGRRQQLTELRAHDLNCWQTFNASEGRSGCNCGAEPREGK